MRSDVQLVDPSFPDPLRSAGPRDVVLTLTFRPYARATLELIALARGQGAQIVLITDVTAHQFIGSDDVVLSVPVDSPTLVLSFTPALAILETLIAEVAMLDVDQTHDQLEATARFVDAQALTLERGTLGTSADAPRPRRRRGRD